VALFFIRLATFVLSALAILIAVVPILVLIDLLGGVVLTLGFLATVVGIRLLMRLARHIQSGEYQVTQ
jgi:hypothetical protein